TGKRCIEPTTRLPLVRSVGPKPGRRGAKLSTGPSKAPKPLGERILLAGLIVVFVSLFLLFCVVWPIGILMIPYLDDAEISRAKMDVKTLEKACKAYHDAYGVWPKDLATLARDQPDGKPAYIDPATLIDPWGNAYNYDPTQLHPRVNLPLVWSDGRSPGWESS